MPDEIDSANETAELLTQAAFKNSRRKTSTLTPVGYCLCESCGLEFDKSDPEYSRKLFCDANCARQYELESSRR
jgi:hypothetical protein